MGRARDGRRDGRIVETAAEDDAGRAAVCEEAASVAVIATLWAVGVIARAATRAAAAAEIGAEATDATTIGPAIGSLILDGSPTRRRGRRLGIRWRWQGGWCRRGEIDAGHAAVEAKAAGATEAACLAVDIPVLAAACSLRTAEARACAARAAAAGPAVSILIEELWRRGRSLRRWRRTGWGERGRRLGQGQGRR